MSTAQPPSVPVAPTAARRPTILVTGDVVVDHHVYVGTRLSAIDGAKAPAIEVVEFGGAALVERLLDRNDEEDAPWQVSLGLLKNADLYPHCHAVWEPQSAPRAGAKDPKVWRARALGYRTAGAERPTDDTRLKTAELTGALPSGTSGPTCPTIDPSAPTHPEILVVDDAGVGFRDAEGCFPSCLAAGARLPSWLVWKMSGGLGGGRFWGRVGTHSALLCRTVVLVTAADLRRAGHDIGLGISWEQTSFDTVNALRAIKDGPLARARHVVVSFHGAGALWMDRDGGGASATALVFDPAGIEADPAEAAPGTVFGFQACLAGGIAWCLASPREEHVAEDADAADRDTILRGIRSGLAARRVLYSEGHGFVGKGTPCGFPARRIRKAALSDSPQQFAHVVLPPNPGAEKWSLLETAAGAAGTRGPLYTDGRLVAVNGTSALAGIPSLTVGHFATVDRVEIEALRRVERLVKDYVAAPQKRPLSIALFGAPGAGKSFLAEELAKHLFGKEPPYLAFNLSQLYDERDLIGAFHRVRDLVLAGKTPLVLWDEFDAQEYRWLRLLLAPMNDGAFQEGQILHPIGKSVFVFAGGTSSTLREFARAARAKRHAKGPDFVTRLHGHLDILGPNQRTRTPAGADSDPVVDETDICLPIRRALFLRGKLAGMFGGFPEVAPELIDALLRVPRYTHGSRSFDRVIASIGAAGVPITRESLPPREVLATDVSIEPVEPPDGDAPDAGLRGADGLRAGLAKRADVWREAESAATAVTQAIGADLDTFAARIHAAYMTLPERARNRDLAKAFAELSPFFQESNRAAVLRITPSLAAAGLRVVAPDKAASACTREQAHAWLERFLDLAASEEHRGWCAFYTENGWTPAKTQDEPRDRDKKKHEALFPWEVLYEPNRDKDRRQVRIYLDIVYELRFAATWD